VKRRAIIEWLYSDQGPRSRSAIAIALIQSALFLLTGRAHDRDMQKKITVALLSLAFLSGESRGEDSGNWPSFRGQYAAGVAEDQNLPLHWDATKNEGVRYKVAVPGLAHSSPIVFGDRIYLTTAVSSEESASFKPGLYGSGDASSDRSVHEWQVICLDKNTGEILWQKTATKGQPKDKRHIKATYANSTPATDGEHVVAFFGSQGVFCLNAEGEILWQRDLGRLDVGAYDLPSYEWGSASSPIIHDGKVFVQCDTQNDSFLVALDVKTGETIWNTPRDELPSWGTPTVYPGGEGKRAELIINGSNFIRGYDPATGKELWRLGGSSKITAPTPVFSGDLFIVASGRSPERPIFAIRAGAEGDITLTKNTTSNDSVAWSLTRRGPYMPTPLIYQGRVYVLSNDGPFACYDLKTGTEFYRLRLPHRGDGFSASPVAADGRIYLASESGSVFVVKAGDEFELLASNAIGEPMMATPAISGGMLLIRGAKHLFAIGNE
jgi:outer membrane protein assembly factor BamB